MPRNEEGEFEIVMGNRQLLGVFFIVVVLLGVFFTMGYILGRNSAPSTGLPETASQPKKGDEVASARPLVVDSAAPAARAPAEAKPESKPPEPKPEEPKPPETKAPETKPPETKASAPKPSAPKPSAPKVPEIKPASPKAAEKKAEPPPSPAKPATPSPPERLTAATADANEPPAGTTFLQVAAVKKPEAQLIAKVLSQKGFAAWVAPGPNDTVFRVLVGPVKDAAAVAKTRTDLEAAGFKPIVRRY